MPLRRTKPCSTCRRWFTPDARIGKRQRTCGKAECQAGRRRKKQAAWRARNPDYFTARRLQEREGQEEWPAPLKMPAPLTRLPWDLAQSEFGVQRADFIAVMGKVLLRVAQSKLRAQMVERIAVSGTHGGRTAQSQIRHGP